MQHTCLINWALFFGQWGSNQYHTFISVVVKELLNTEPEDGLAAQGITRGALYRQTFNLFREIKPRFNC